MNRRGFLKASLIPSMLLATAPLGRVHTIGVDVVKDGVHVNTGTVFRHVAMGLSLPYELIDLPAIRSRSRDLTRSRFHVVKS